MRILRGAFIIGLLLMLPALAIRGNVSDLLQWTDEVLAANGDSVVSDIDSDAVEENDDAGQDPRDATTPSDEPIVTPAPPATLYKRPNAAMPKFDSAKDDEQALRPGKRLRPAIYRPMADDDSPSIRRILASHGKTAATKATAIDEIQLELRQRGAQRYRLEQHGTNFRFTCEFPPPDAAATPRVFQADADDRAQAMRAVLAQVRDWDRVAIR